MMSLRISNTIATHDHTPSHQPRLRLTLWVLLSVGFLLQLSEAAAQLRMVPLERKAPHLSKPLRKKNSAARGQSITRQLPFWDDFSFTPTHDTANDKADYPQDTLWWNSNSVWVNEGMGINPPSRNVATFDGLNAQGQTYSTQILANGFRDTLTSQPIDLTTVAEADRSTVYLSFFYQWQGNGEAPDPKDYILVEFLNADSVWEEGVRVPFRSTADRTVFRDTIVQVNGDQFFHDHFQFRFRNYGRQSGPYDTWNIDYVYLNKNRNATDRYTPDGALASTVSGIFNPYYAVPLDHFWQSPVISQAKVDVFNLRGGGVVSYNYRADVTYRNYVGNQTLSQDQNLVKSRGIGTNSNGTPNGIINSYGRVQVQLFKQPDPAFFDPGADSIDVQLKFRLISNDVVDTLGNPSIDYASVYKPIDFRANDTLSVTYTLNNYYAYDDGTAEYAVTLTQPGDRAAYRFDMISNTKDTLVGFYIYAPAYGLSGSLTTDFYIYGDANGAPGNILYTIPSRAIASRPMNVFQLIRTEPVLVEKTFYIAWKAPSSGLFRVGLDLNTQAVNKIYDNTNGTWLLNDGIPGSIMIRPVFGSGTVTGIERELLNTSVYPNPSDGAFFITGAVDELEVLSVTGQSIPFHREALEDRSRITIKAVPGLYVLRIRRGNAQAVHKIVVR
jgi:hypothetical protein